MNLPEMEAPALTVAELTAALAEPDTHCQHAGCPNIGVGVYDTGGTTEPDAYYCFTHMTDEGYCWGCLYAMAGTEAFDFSESGLCGECQANPDVTGEEPEDDEYEYWAEFDDPEDYDHADC